MKSPGHTAPRADLPSATNSTLQWRPRRARQKRKLRHLEGQPPWARSRSPCSRTDRASPGSSPRLIWKRCAWTRKLSNIAASTCRGANHGRHGGHVESIRARCQVYTISMWSTGGGRKERSPESVRAVHENFAEGSICCRTRPRRARSCEGRWSRIRPGPPNLAPSQQKARATQSLVQV